MIGKHAILSPSGAHRWMACPGSVFMEQGRPNRDSKYSAEGTAAHEVAAACLRSATRLVDFYVGKKAENGVEITEDMAAEVQKYVDFVRELMVSYGTDAVLLVEQGLPLEPLTGEEGAEGTGDVVMVTPDELVVVDLKFGMGHQVDAERNPQLMMYALAAWHVWSLLQDFKTIRLIVHQPRLNHVSEWSCTVAELLAFGDVVATAAAACWAQFDANRSIALAPGEDQCQWCKASGDCSAQDTTVLMDTGVGEFEDLTATPEVGTTDLGIKLDKVHFIQDWCKKVQALGELELRAGNSVVGAEGPYKLVRGRKGSRAWKDAVEVENTLKAMRIKHDLMYDYKIVSPTRAQELAKSGDLGPRNWKKLQEYIHQSEGGLTVAKASDKRDAVVAEKDVFEDLTESAGA
jgi:hypothetical protein